MESEELRDEEKKDKKKSIKSIILIIVIAVVGVIAGTVGTIIGNKFTHKTEPKTEVLEVEKKYNKDEVSVPLEEFLVNLAEGQDKETSYIRIELSLLTSSSKNAEIITSNNEVVRDSIINKLRQKDSASILADQNGVNKLKEELRDQINKDYGSALVREVFITNLVIQ
ncbi:MULTISPECIES: flagellar basal body-associated FliL family protein [Vagococcus]|uniref:Flagellar protein FliL n=1 Tax=Vagococcus fluvialis bH819 TaxID=1255619 RepID=A0A1X6WRH9_9ENTE|nr:MULTISPECIES: flagellar basal body-associated FliL family protein [Vagococcus]SLM86887.1 hypothetical protein FM121_12370 [Vagococcus fluvialis bH819]HCM88656.1 hypothetical protein [Vagococcus sp.]